ncbi:MAG: hypothetical protein KBC33_03475 [Candidatus Pacebacteria bacterium]|nr:hypothetical protein [Candidatus Paceibacterota bacterium]
MRTAFFVSVGVVSLTLVVYCASAISSMESFQITAVSVEGVETDGEADALRASALESLHGAYLGIFSRANTLVYPKRTIAARISEEYPWVAAVSMSREGAHTIKLAVTEKKPSALVCLTLPDFNGNDLSLEDPGRCYFADETGYIFRKAPSFSGNVYRRYYMPDLGAGASSTDAIVGAVATSSISFEALEKFYLSISDQGIIADAILVKPEGEYELYARNIAVDAMPASTVVVYFNDSSPLDEQATNFVSFWRHTTDQARAKKQSVRYDSIDIRYGSNVFYRESK